MNQVQKTAQSALTRLFRRRVPTAQPAFIPAPLDGDGLPNLEPDTATFQTAYPNISSALGAARPNNVPTGGAQALARDRYWQNALSVPAQAAAAQKPPAAASQARPGAIAPKLPSPSTTVATQKPQAPGAPTPKTPTPAAPKPSSQAPLVRRYKPVGRPGSGSTSVVAGMYAADAPGTYASLDEAKASYNAPVVASAPTQGSSPMKKAAVDRINSLGAQLKLAQVDQDIRDEFANPHQGPVRKPSYIPPKSPSMLAQLGGEATWAGESSMGRGAAIGAVAGAGFNALRTAVGNIRRKKNGEPAKSVLGGALTGGLVGGGLGAGAGYAMKQAEVARLNQLGTHLRTLTAK